jgi:flagellar basal body P-ring protein FlgI
MTPNSFSQSRYLAGLSLPLAVLLSSGGCTSQVVLPQNSTAKVVESETETINQEGVTLIRDLSTPWGDTFIKLEGVALVTGLTGTGSDPPPSPLRTTLISEMQTHEVKRSNQILSSPNVSLVLVRCYLPPGVQKNDRLDVEVRVPSKSETTSLRGGWLMRTRLRELAVLDSAMHSGRVSGSAEGYVLVDAIFGGGDDKVAEVRGRVLGGGVSLVSRPVGLEVQTENRSIRTSSLVGTAINARFHTFDHGVKKGVATPKRDNFVELEVHPRYRHNLVRYMHVVRNIAFTESPADRIRRIELLERKLLDPATATAAALQLEAIGKESLSVLHKAVRSPEPEVRFYTAEALAYMDDPEAAAPLAEAAHNTPAFRWHAIAALSAMDHGSAHDALVELLHVPSAETRYAAFRALQTRNPHDPLVRGEELAGGAFHYHVIRTSGPPMVHFARSGRPEIVVFGDDLQLQSPAFFNAGKNILLKAAGANRLRAMRFAARQEDRQETCSTRLNDVVRTIARLDGGYADVLQALQEAKSREYLGSRLVIDALPRPGRVYRRDDEQGDGGDKEPERLAATPLAGMFATATPGSRDDDENRGPPEEVSAESKSKGVMQTLGEWIYKQ